MARRRSRHTRTVVVRERRSFRRRFGGIRIPLAVVAGLAPGIANVYGFRSYGVEGMAAQASRVYLGYATTNKFGFNDTIGFHPYLLKYGTLPIVAGGLVHIVANKLGINRALRSIPFIQI